MPARQTAYSRHHSLPPFLHTPESSQTMSGNHIPVHWRRFLSHRPSILLRNARYFRISHFQGSPVTGYYNAHYNPEHHFLPLSHYHLHHNIHNSAHGYPTETDTSPCPYYISYMPQRSPPEYLHFPAYSSYSLHHKWYNRSPRYRSRRDASPSRSVS